MDEEAIQQNLSLIIRKSCFGLPTACPNCLPVYIYLKFANIPFDLTYNLTYPDSGTYFLIYTYTYTIHTYIYIYIITFDIFAD